MIRKAISKMSGYTPGEQPQKKVVKLNTNENPYSLPDLYYEELKSTVGSSLRLYPDPLCSKLTGKLACYHEVSPESILCGNGSDEILRMIFDMVLEPGDEIGIMDPTYSLYPVLAEIREAVLKTYPLDEEGLPDEQPFSFNGKLFVIASPNPPYGNIIPWQWIKRFLEHFDGLVIIDEAYVDFASSCWVQEITRYPKLVIARTYSKSFSLAGARFGYAIANPALIRDLIKIKDSYNVNCFTQQAAIKALDYHEDIVQNIQKIIRTRQWLSRELSDLGWKVYPSEANFIFAEHPRAKQIFEYLKNHDIYVRFFDTPRLSKGLRITIGTAAECEALLSKIKVYLDANK